MIEKTIQIDSQNIAVYESTGSSQNVILIHGNSSSGNSFKHQLDSPLGEKYHLIAIDLPGHGNSSPASDPQSDYTLPGYANIVVEIIKKLGLNNGIFVGWGLGGNVLLEALSEFPDALGIMIFGTTPLAKPLFMKKAFHSHPAVSRLLQTDLTDEDINIMVSSFIKPDSQTPLDFINYVKKTDKKTRQYLSMSLTNWRYKDEIDIFGRLKSMPLAILHGTEDQLVNVKYINTIRMPTLWRKEVQTISGAGHSPHWEQPDKFNKLLEAFIEDIT